MAAGPEIASRGVILRQPIGTLCCAASRTPCRKNRHPLGKTSHHARADPASVA